MPYSKRLDVLNLTTLEKRRLRGDLIEVYKLLTGRENIDHTALLQLDDSCYGTRGHKYKLKKYRSRLDIRKHFFSNRVVSHWNSLPSHFVDADTVWTFKKRLDVCNEWCIQSWWSFLANSPTSTSYLQLQIMRARRLLNGSEKTKQLLNILGCREEKFRNWFCCKRWWFLWHGSILIDWSWRRMRFVFLFQNWGVPVSWHDGWRHSCTRGGCDETPHRINRTSVVRYLKSERR